MTSNAYSGPRFFVTKGNKGYGARVFIETTATNVDAMYLKQHSVWRGFDKVATLNGNDRFNGYEMRDELAIEQARAFLTMNGNEEVIDADWFLPAL